MRHSQRFLNELPFFPTFLSSPAWKGRASLLCAPPGATAAPEREPLASSFPSHYALMERVGKAGAPSSAARQECGVIVEGEKEKREQFEMG